jgi:hypothetical protein
MENPTMKNDNETPRVPIPLKSLTRLANDLREHAYRYALDNGQLCADLHQAANYLDAVANHD